MKNLFLIILSILSINTTNTQFDLWEPIPAIPELQVLKTWISPTNEIFVQSVNNNLYHSEDGVSWNRIEGLDLSRFEQILFYSDGTPVINLRLQNYYYVRINSTWETISFGAFSSTDFQIENDELYITSGSQLIKTSNRGESFEVVIPDLRDAGHDSKFFFFENHIAQLFTYGASAYLSKYSLLGSIIDDKLDMPRIRPEAAFSVKDGIIKGFTTSEMIEYSTEDLTVLSQMSTGNLGITFGNDKFNYHHTIYYLNDNKVFSYDLTLDDFLPEIYFDNPTDITLNSFSINHLGNTTLTAYDDLYYYDSNITVVLETNITDSRIDVHTVLNNGDIIDSKGDFIYLFSVQSGSWDTIEVPYNGYHKIDGNGMLYYTKSSEIFRFNLYTKENKKLNLNSSIFSDINILGGNTVFLNTYGKLYFSRDQGDSFDSIATDNYVLDAYNMISDGNIVVSINFDEVIIINTKNKTIKELPFENSAIFGLRAVIYDDYNVLFFNTFDNILYITKDGGDTYENLGFIDGSWIYH